MKTLLLAAVAAPLLLIPTPAAPAPQVSGLFALPSVSWHASGELAGQVGDVIDVPLPGSITVPGNPNIIDPRYRVYIANYSSIHILSAEDKIYPRLALQTYDGSQTLNLLPGAAAHGVGSGWVAGWGGALRVDGDGVTRMQVHLTGNAGDTTIYTMTYQISGFAERL